MLTDLRQQADRARPTASQGADLWTRPLLMTADTLGGVWTYALELTAALKGWGINIALATLGRALRREQWEAAARLGNLQIHESRFRLEWMADPWGDVARAAEWLRKLADTLKPCLFHFNHYCNAAHFWGAPKLVVAHSDVITWWQAVKRSPAPPEWQRYRGEVSQALRAADIVIAPSRALLSELQQVYGPLPKAEVIPNGRYVPPLETGWRKEEFVLGVGRVWDEAKNLRVLEEVAPLLLWPVKLAGCATHPDGGKAEFSQVQLLGELPPESLLQVFRSAAIYCLPAKYEPFGLSVVEAALSGCALVLGRTPSLMENWRGAARFVDPDDPVALAAALNGLIRDPKACVELARKGQQRALQFGPERMAATYVNTYRELLARTPACVS